MITEKNQDKKVISSPNHTACKLTSLHFYGNPLRFVIGCEISK